MSASDLISRVTSGDRRALARGISHLENGGTKATQLLDHIPYDLTSSHIIGITGPPGSGKSTLVDRLLHHYRDQDLTIGVLAVDPTSPYSGGALLGDRIRMLSKTSDPGVYIRSLASRGQLGGLSPYTHDVIRLMQMAGFDKIIVETVGAGQSEIDIVRNSDTTIVLSVPGLGDDIQVIKAGIMEIADLFVINKSDLPGSSGLKLQIKNMLDLIPDDSAWHPPVLEVSAQADTGVDSLVTTIDDHLSYLHSTSLLEDTRLQQLQFDLRNKFFHHLGSQLAGIDSNPVASLVSDLVAGEITLSQAIHQLHDDLLSTESNN